METTELQSQDFIHYGKKFLLGITLYLISILIGWRDGGILNGPCKEQFKKFECLKQMIRPYAICLPDIRAECIPLI